MQKIYNNSLGVRKIVLMLFVLLIMGCRNEGVYHTYYKDIDIDTMVAIPGDGTTSELYVIKMMYLDSAMAKALQTDTIIEVIYFEPATLRYYMQLIGSNGTVGDKIEFDPVSYKTGDMPFKGSYGDGIYERNTRNSLKIKNDSTTDALVSLETPSNKLIRQVYIRKNEEFKIRNIPGGAYVIKIMLGNEWNSEKDNGINKPKGGFMKDVFMYRSKNEDIFEFPEPSSRYYMLYEVVLYRVSDGSLEMEFTFPMERMSKRYLTKRIDTNEFFN